MSHFAKRIIIAATVMALTIGLANAQFVMTQNEYEIPLSYSLVPEDLEMDSEEQETLFFMSIPIEKLLQAAREEGGNITANEQKIYYDGENFAADVSSEMGKMTTILNVKDGMMYNVMWSQKQVMVISPDDMKEAEAQTNEAVQEMMKNLSPEMQAQMKEAMEQEEQEKQKKSMQKSSVKSSGKKMKINGFDCELYTMKKYDGEITGIWAAADNMKITGNVDKMMGQLGKMFEMEEEGDEETDEWLLVKGKIPVEVRRLNLQTAMGEPAFYITAIQKIEQKMPSAEKFHVPDEKDGFKHITFSEYYKQMMQR